MRGFSPGVRQALWIDIPAALLLTLSTGLTVPFGGLAACAAGAAAETAMTDEMVASDRRPRVLTACDMSRSPCKIGALEVEAS